MQWRDLADRLNGKAPQNAARSSRWRTVRDKYLYRRSCIVCLGRRHLIAHHVIPFHLAPDLELDVDNLVCLCEAKRYGINCHLLIGHLGNWRRANPFVIANANYWRTLIKGI